MTICICINLTHDHLNPTMTIYIGINLTHDHKSHDHQSIDVFRST
jgi:hypothetical protein